MVRNNVQSGMKGLISRCTLFPADTGGASESKATKGAHFLGIDVDDWVDFFMNVSNAFLTPLLRGERS